MAHSDVIVLAVQTPSGNEGQVDIPQVSGATTSIRTTKGTSDEHDLGQQNSMAGWDEREPYQKYKCICVVVEAAERKCKTSTCSGSCTGKEMVRDPCNLYTKEPFPQSHAGEQYTVSSLRSLSLSLTDREARSKQPTVNLLDAAISLGSESKQSRTPALQTARAHPSSVWQI